MVASVLYYLVNLGDYIREDKFYDRLDAELEKGKKEIYIKDITWFDWKKVCWFRSYSFYSGWKENIEESIEEPNIWETDGISYFVFITPENEAIILEHWDHGYGSLGNENICTDSRDAKLVWYDERYELDEKSRLKRIRDRYKRTEKEYQDIDKELAKYSCTEYESYCFTLVP